jgi:hypothetical protein
MKSDKILFVCLLIISIILIANLLFKEKELMDVSKKNPFTQRSPFIKCKLDRPSDIEKAQKLEKDYSEFNKILTSLINDKLFTENDKVIKELAFKVYDNKNKADITKNKLLKIVRQI